jgi:hypothetical protein
MAFGSNSQRRDDEYDPGPSYLELDAYYQHQNNQRRQRERDRVARLQALLATGALGRFIEALAVKAAQDDIRSLRQEGTF